MRTLTAIVWRALTPWRASSCTTHTHTHCCSLQAHTHTHARAHVAILISWRWKCRCKLLQVAHKNVQTAKALRGSANCCFSLLCVCVCERVCVCAAHFFLFSCAFAFIIDLMHTLNSLSLSLSLCHILHGEQVVNALSASMKGRREGRGREREVLFPPQMTLLH